MTTPTLDSVWIASFDIGKKNFAFCIEEIIPTQLSAVDNIPFTERYYKDGTQTTEFAKLMKQVTSNGKIVLLKNIDLTDGATKKKILDPIVFLNMTRVLDEYKEYWNNCVAFVIEQQMSFGKKSNPMAMKLGQHCYSYFIIQYSDFKTTLEFPAYHKTKVLGAPRKMSKYQRKMWSVEKAMEILIDRDDKVALGEITSRKKKDDMGDVITQIQAFKYMTYIDKCI